MKTPQFYPSQYQNKLHLKLKALTQKNEEFTINLQEQRKTIYQYNNLQEKYTSTTIYKKKTKNKKLRTYLQLQEIYSQ